MAGGAGKYNHRLVAALAEAAAANVTTTTAPPPNRGTGKTHNGVGGDGSPPEGSALPASRRHCWALGPPEDPGPHPALLTGSWVKRESQWFVMATWYSEAGGAVVQQWLDYPH